MEGGVRVTEESIISGIPIYTYEDYISSTTPYEYAYQYIDDSFTLERIITQMSNNAKEVNVKNFRKIFSEYVKKKKKLTKPIALDSVTQFEGQALELSCGAWRADEFGVSIETDYGEKFACNHPILPIMRLVNIDTGVEKLMISYRKGKQWRNTLADKKTLASNNSILELANVGVGVTSENSKLLVQYLHDVESLNYDLIPEKNSVSRLGWIEGEGFSPYVENLVFDGDVNFKSYFESVQCHGDYDTWLDLAKKVRSGNVFPRLILAASFASVLVKPLGGLPFFLHIWGGTEVGKTVGLMLAASVWANSEVGRYIHTFNSTSVGREKSAAFVNSLPLILDELQIIKDKKDFDQSIYMLSEGAGRTRGNKSGGVDKTPTWSNCIITSGEMPITNASSGGGAVNRILEVECTERLFDDPRHVANTLKSNYGFAGKAFVELLQVPEMIEAAQIVYEQIYAQTKTEDTMEKQAGAAALVLTADKLVTDWIFKDDKALTVKEISEFLKSKEAVSVNQRAYEYICEYVVQNKNKFCGSSEITEVLGRLEEGKVYIIRNAFNRICDEGNFNSSSFLSWLKQKRLIETKSNRNTISKRINGVPCNCVSLTLLSDTEENDYHFLGEDD